MLIENTFLQNNKFTREYLVLKCNYLKFKQNKSHQCAATLAISIQIQMIHGSKCFVCTRKYVYSFVIHN